MKATLTLLALCFTLIAHAQTQSKSAAKPKSAPKATQKPATKPAHKPLPPELDPQNIEMRMDREANFAGTEEELIDIFMKGIDFPEETIEKNMEGEIMFSFFVGLDGKIENAKVLKSFGNESVDAQALKILQGLTYIPATMNGVVVRSQKMISIPLRAYRKI